MSTPAEQRLETLRQLRADVERELDGEERREALSNIDQLIAGHQALDRREARARGFGRLMSLFIGAPLGGWGIFKGVSFVLAGDGTVVPWVLAALFITGGGAILLVALAHAFTGKDLSFMRIGPRRRP